MATAQQIQLLALYQEQLRRIEERKAIEKRNRPIWEPRPENKPQTMAFASDADVIGYGGSAGGGKTSTAVGMALLKHENTLIVRETFSELSGMIEAFKTTCGDDLSYNATSHIFSVKKALRDRGARARRIQLGYLDRFDDIKKYQGNEFDFIVLEEATNLDELQCRTVLTWNRTTTPGQKCQAFMTWNPPTNPAGAWVINFFAPWLNENHPLFPVPSGTVMHVAMFDNEEYFTFEPATYTHNPITGAALRVPQSTQSRVFFRASYKDNPMLGEDYQRRLANLPEAERNRLMFGEMTAYLVDGYNQIIRQSHYEAAQERWRERVKTNDPRKFPPSVIAVDLAEGGADSTVFTPVWWGGFVGEQHEIKGVHLDSGADNVAALAKYMFDQWGVSPDNSRDERGHPTLIIYDGIGTPGGAFGATLEQEYPQAYVSKFVGSTAPGVRGVFGCDDYPVSQRSGLPIASGDGTFTNKITAAWVRFGQMLEHGAYSICLPPSITLRGELTARQISREVGSDKGRNQRISIESKAEFKARLKKSPDLADSAVMGVWGLDREGSRE